MSQALEDLRAYLELTARLQRQSHSLPKGYHYFGTDDYILDRGDPFDSAPLSEKEKEIILTAIDTRKQHFPQGQCFYNAQMLALADMTSTIQYCEGWASGPVCIPIFHAWNLINGKVVDLTWRTKARHNGRLSNRVFGKIPEDWAYYGVPFSLDAVRHSCLRDGSAHSLLDDWENKFPFFRQRRRRKP
jgi:hypothetical protein